MPTIPDALITTYLHMTHQDQFKPAFLNIPGVSIMTLDNPDVSFYRFLYDSVGDQLQWRDRRLMSVTELLAIITDSNVSIFVLYVEDEPAGYVELEKIGTETEIAYFGLIPGHIGLGLGKHLLSFAIDQAWEGGAERVTVHTCNLDSPAALPNYLKRGFEVYNVQSEPMPERYRI